jgi:hypothetical protein
VRRERSRAALVANVRVAVGLLRSRRSIRRIEAGARYGMDRSCSLLPGNAAAHVGSLSARALRRRAAWVTSGIPAAVGAARAALLAVLVLAAAGGALPAWTALVLGAPCGRGCLLWARHRPPRPAALHLLEVFGSLGRSPSGALRILGWLAGSIVARVLAVAAVSASPAWRHRSRPHS